MLVRHYFRADIAVESKDDATPVTKADREIERLWRGMIEKAYPAHGISGEEYGDVRMDAEYIWALDPIDGTRAFSAGKPLFGMLISLLYQGRPVLGLIDQPILEERWLGVEGQGAYLNGLPVRTRPCDALSQAVMNVATPYFLRGDLARLDPFRALDAVCKTASLGGDCYAYGLLASGHCDLIVEDSLDLHDFAALAPIVAEAGGVMSDWQGKTLGQHSDGRVVAAGDARVWRETITLLSKFP